MKRLLLTPLLGFLLIGASTLVSCAAQSVVPGYRGEPTTAGATLAVEGIEIIPGLDPWVRAYSADDVLTIVTVGSSSCPWVPEVTEVDRTEMRVDLRLEAWDPEGSCTADMAPRTFELPVEDDLTDFIIDVAVVEP